MKYNGIELTEMLPGNWDGKSRNMLVWCDDTKPIHHIVCGYDPIHCVWLVAETQAVWKHCAEIPTEEKDDAMKLVKDTEEALSSVLVELRRQMIELNVDAAIHKLNFADFVESAGYGSDRCYHRNDSLSGNRNESPLNPGSNRFRGFGCGYAAGEGVVMSRRPFDGLPPYGLLRDTGEYSSGTGRGSGIGAYQCWRVDGCDGASR